MEKNVRPQNETWKVFGSDEVLEDKNLIEYYKLHLYDEKLKSKLLGEFTSEGKYVLPDEIKKMLVGVKKLITYSGNDSYAAETTLKTRSIRFLVKYWSAGDKSAANLYFIENFEGEDIKTFVAQFVGIADDNFVLRMKSAFNLYSEIDELADKYLEELENQYAILQTKKVERDFVVELQSEFYMYEILEILKAQGGEKGKQVAEQIEIEIDSKKQLTNKEGMYTALRLKMDKMIIAAGGFNVLKQKIPTLPKIVQNYTKPVKDYDEISKKLDAMKPPTDEAVPNKSGGGTKKSKSAANKSGGGKNGRGSGKDTKSKKANKKTDMMIGYKRKVSSEPIQKAQVATPKRKEIVKNAKLVSLVNVNIPKSVVEDKAKTATLKKDTKDIVKKGQETNVEKPKSIFDLANPDLLLGVDVKFSTIAPPTGEENKYIPKDMYKEVALEVKKTVKINDTEVFFKEILNPEEEKKETVEMSL